MDFFSNFANFSCYFLYIQISKEYGFKGISTLLRKTCKLKLKKLIQENQKNNMSILLFQQHSVCTANCLFEQCKAHILMKIIMQFITKR
jgi:hypothetical protein